MFFDESGISLLPVTRRTWSPRGTTPILRHRCNWKRASMAAALGYHASDGERGPRLCFHVQKDSYNTQTLIGVLEQLGRWWRAWSTAPPPLQLRLLLDSAHTGRPLHLYLSP